MQAHGIVVGGMGGSVLGSVGRWLDRGISRLMGGDAAPSDGSVSDDDRRSMRRSPPSTLVRTGLSSGL